MFAIGGRQFPGFTQPIEAGSEWGTHHLSQQDRKRWGISSISREGTFGVRQPFDFCHPSGLSVPWAFWQHPRCRTKRACRRVVIWTEPRLRYQYYGEIKILAR